MIIKQLTEVIYKFANEGRPKATARTIRKEDIEQMVMVDFGSFLRQRYYESKKLNEFGEADYSAISAILGVIEFKLSEPNNVGMRRADMSKFDLYRIPFDGHITDMYPVGGKCGSDEVGKISLVKAGEEKFYLKPKFDFFKFAVVKGRGINFYHLPTCVEEVAIEATYNSGDVDVSFDLCFQIANNILGTILKLPNFENKVIDNPYSSPQIELRRSLKQQEG
jgi:hypothetical protein